MTKRLRRALGPRRRARRAAPSAAVVLLRPRTLVALGTAATAMVLVGTLAVSTFAQTPAADREIAGQTLVVPDYAAVMTVPRDSYSASEGVDSLVAGGTNQDWAKLVLLYGGWPRTDENVTVILRWMRQENYVKTWWNRNNPLNNGWGSGGGGGTGSYPSLRSAAENAAEALNTHPGYAGIRESFAASSTTDATEQAIWASPWATGHYANGGHWHYEPVEVVTAPAEAW
ncbi:hypothetical protein [Homoserinimonas aerilata]|uniref:hypothetical protein n=1 Tax=Homoserinimonas aerilata TaxID=1162970 RepID=UPI001FEBEDE6|nr:hypothetical protein [Homoserinimonas aerilata]